jgi:hypothetical protein
MTYAVMSMTADAATAAPNMMASVVFMVKTSLYQSIVPQQGFFD